VHAVNLAYKYHARPFLLGQDGRQVTRPILFSEAWSLNARRRMLLELRPPPPLQLSNGEER
jgi:hypothetical protein